MDQKGREMGRVISACIRKGFGGEEKDKKRKRNKTKEIIKKREGMQR